MELTQQRQISQGEGAFQYTLIRKNVKNINLSVKSDGSVTVSANRRVPENYIDDFVRSKIPFIQKARNQVQKNRVRTPALQFVTGEQVPYLGRHLTLQVRPADYRLIPGWMEKVQEGSITRFSKNKYGEAVFCWGDQLYLYTLEMEDAVHKQLLYESWQKIQAGILCDQLSRYYYPAFQKLGVAYPMIKIRKMSSRWGSCIPQKQKVTFNSQLLEKPLESIEYVVVHEFSHFIHPDHSKAFHSFVEQILPDWRIRRQRLK